MFGGAAPNRTETGQPNADGVFADVFDEVYIIYCNFFSMLFNLYTVSCCVQRLNNTYLGGAGLVLSAEQA